MLEKKRIYISDVHMNAGQGINSKEGKYSYEWLGKSEADRFAEFLKYVNTLDDVKEIIIIGDLMDNWVCPVDIIPPSFQEIIDADVNKDIVALLRELSAKNAADNDAATVYYLPGNHDMGVTQQLVEKNFPGMFFAGNSLHNNAYRTGRLLAEHGSGHAMFNAPDSINSPGNKIPLGYFITRVVATKEYNTGNAARHYWTYFDDLIDNMVGMQTISSSIFEAILEEAGLSDDTEIYMSSSKNKGIRPSKDANNDESSIFSHTSAGDEEITKISAKTVKEKYANLYSQWSTKHEPDHALKGIMAETDLLGKIADKLCKKGDTDIVVFGHTHDWKLDKDSRLVGDRIYANTGCWCDKDKPQTYIESQKDPERRKHLVRAIEWRDGEPVVLKEKSINY